MCNVGRAREAVNILLFFSFTSDKPKPKYNYSILLNVVVRLKFFWLQNAVSIHLWYLFYQSQFFLRLICSSQVSISTHISFSFDTVLFKTTNYKSCKKQETINDDKWGLMVDDVWFPLTTWVELPARIHLLFTTCFVVSYRAQRNPNIFL